MPRPVQRKAPGARRLLADVAGDRQRHARRGNDREGPRQAHRSGNTMGSAGDQDLRRRRRRCCSWSASRRCPPPAYSPRLALVAIKINWPTVSAPSSVIAVGAAVALPTRAMAPAALGTTPVFQLVVSVQLLLSDPCQIGEARGSAGERQGGPADRQSCNRWAAS